MQTLNHQERGMPNPDDTLEIADAVARAAHIWVRSLCLSEMQEPPERHSMACGLVSGLCERLELDSRIQALVAYVYALIDDEGPQALAASRLMLAHSSSALHRQAYVKGRAEAAAIVEMLAYGRRDRNNENNCNDKPPKERT